MKKRSAAAVLFFFSITCGIFCQESHSKWQVGTIMAVATHSAADQGTDQNTDTRKYDVSVKVGKTMYVVLFTPPDGSDLITHRTGLDVLVSVGAKTMAFNSLLGRKIEVPIVSRKPLMPPAKS